MYYVIRRQSDGAYVTFGGDHSYTFRLEHARLWVSRSMAEREACSNERVEMIDHILSMRRGGQR